MSNELEASRAVTPPVNGEDITGSAIAQIGKPGFCRSSAPVLCRKGHAVLLSHMARGRGGWRGQHGDFNMSCLGGRCREPDAPACDGAMCSLAGRRGPGGDGGPQLYPSKQGPAIGHRVAPPVGSVWLPVMRWQVILGNKADSK